MNDMSSGSKATASGLIANPQRKQNLVRQATELAKILNTKGTLDAFSIFSDRKDIDLLKLEKGIRRYRRALALQASILDELEAEIEDTKRKARKKKPAKSKTRK